MLISSLGCWLLPSNNSHPSATMLLVFSSSSSLLSYGGVGGGGGGGGDPHFSDPLGPNPGPLSDLLFPSSSLFFFLVPLIFFCVCCMSVHISLWGGRVAVTRFASFIATIGHAAVLSLSGCCPLASPSALEKNRRTDDDAIGPHPSLGYTVNALLTSRLLSPSLFL